MANFDTDKWYQITVQARSNLSMLGSPLYDHGKGAVFFGTTNTSQLAQRWQIFPFSGAWALRTQRSGSDSYLGTSPGNNLSEPGNTVPLMREAELSDESMFWSIEPWGDGTFFMTNKANGSAWHLQYVPGEDMSMSSNITKPQEGQSFSFTGIAGIDDARYSSINMPSATSSSTTSSSGSASRTASVSSVASSTSPSSSPSHGLSTGASAAIGASIGGVGFILLLIALFLLLRRHKNGQERSAPSNAPPAYQERPHELKSENTAEVEALPGELPSQHAIAELPGDNHTVPGTR